MLSPAMQAEMRALAAGARVLAFAARRRQSGLPPPTTSRDGGGTASSSSPTRRPPSHLSVDRNTGSRTLSTHVQRSPSPTSSSDVSSSPPPGDIVPGGVQAEYDRRVSADELKDDSYQRKIVESLETLRSALLNYDRASPEPLSFLDGLFRREAKKPDHDAPKGVYIYGTVGCGKTMLMDLFFDTCPFEAKQRVHFHSFMQDIHRKMHELKLQNPGREKGIYDPIPRIVDDLVATTKLLCFDEFQVTDIADAMILRRFFTCLWEAGMVVVATSNRPPRDLYKNGLQRHQFVPFIDLLEENCFSLALDSGIDYRKSEAREQAGIFFVKSPGADVDKDLDAVFKQLIASENDVVRSKALSILGREVEVKKCCGQVADIDFHDVCVKACGAMDYLVLARVFHTIIIRNVPVFTRAKMSEARRFITLVDTFYDQKVRLVCSAEAPVDELFRLTQEGPVELSDTQRVLMDDLKLKHGDEALSSNIFSGSEELFAHDRTQSRLHEMRTAQYWAYRSPSSVS